MANRKVQTAQPDLWTIAFKTLTPVSLVREKQRLIKAIITKRRREGLSQAELGRLADISQSRIAQIEAGIGKGPVSFDMVFLLLHVLKLDIHVILRPARKISKAR